MNKFFKKVLEMSSIPFLIASALCIINYLLTRYTDFCIGINFHGGEVISTVGFGVVKNTFYPEMHIGEEITSSFSIEFEPISFLITFLVVLIIFKTSKYIVNKLKNKHNK